MGLNAKPVSVMFPLLLTVVVATAVVGAQGPGGGPGPGMGPGYGGDPGTPSGWQDHELEHNLVLPQVAVGPGITTTLLLSSMAGPGRTPWLASGDNEVRGLIHVFGSDGSRLAVVADGELATQGIPFRLLPAQTRFIAFKGTGPQVETGWLLIEVESAQEDTWGMMDGRLVVRGERIHATAYYSLNDRDGNLASRVGVLPAIYQRGHFLRALTTAQYGARLDTGIAIVNTGVEAVHYELTLRDAAGEVVARRSFVLPAGHQQARFVSELFDGLLGGHFRGRLELAADQDGVVAMALLLTDKVFTSLPVHHYGAWRP